MYSRLVYPRNDWDENNINKIDILNLIKKHRGVIAPRLRKNMRYYEGMHKISTRKRDSEINNKIVCNHAKDITDTANGYFLANALTYTSKDEKMDVDRLTDAFDNADVDEIDQDNGLNMSIFGTAFEYVYAREGESEPTSKSIAPTNAFIVVDNSIEERELFGVYYYHQKDDSKPKRYKYITNVMTQNYIYSFEIFEGEDNGPVTEADRQPHYFQEVPLIEYQNNKLCIGDFEQQISLIDAYDYLMSDRINDKEQFLDALLVLYGSILADDEEGTSEALKTLKTDKLLELPESARAEYLTRTFDETGVEVLRKAIKEDIYTFSHVPNLTDENFVGNSSGVAMEFKLLGLEMITKTKTRYYIKGLKKRFKLYCNFLGMKNISINPAAITVNFTRGLPKNVLEISQMVSNLQNFVSKETLLAQIPFVEDPQGEVDAVKKENEESLKKQQELFKRNDNDAPGVEDEEDVDNE